MRAAVAVLLLSASAFAVQGEPRLRYSLHAGDLLEYRERIERRIEEPEASSASEAEWRSRWLVLAEKDGQLQVAVQRTRERTALTAYREKGRDQLAREQPEFEKQLAERPGTVVDANTLNESGWAQGPWAADREAWSLLLPQVRELIPLPEDVARGWWTAGDPSLEWRVEARQPGAGDCLKLTGSSGSGALRVSARFCPADGVVSELDAEARYTLPFERRISERFSFALEARDHREPLDWLARPETRRGVLAGLLAGVPLPLSAPLLHPLLEVQDTGLERQVLALLYRQRLPAPAAATLARLRQSAEPTVASLAARLSQSDAPSRRGPAAPAPGASLRSMRSASFTGWPYVLYVPDAYRGDEPFPLVVALSGGPGLALLGWLDAAEALRGRGYLAVCPQAQGMWWDKPATAALKALLDELQSTLAIDPARVHLVGWSNGGTGAIRYAALWPERFASAVLLESAGLRFYDGDDPLDVVKLRALPLLFVHGTKDNVIPAANSQDAAKRLSRRPGPAVTLKLLEGRGHDLGVSSEADLIFPFFESHAKPPAEP